MVMAAKDMRVFWENLILASTKTLWNFTVLTRSYHLDRDISRFEGIRAKSENCSGITKSLW